MKNIVTWFEIPATDFERCVKFYSEILQVEISASPMGSARMGFFPSGEQAVSGAIVSGEGYRPSPDGCQVYLNGAPDLNEILNRVENAGGKVVIPKTLISEEIGYYARFTDTEGNRISLHSPK